MALRVEGGSRSAAGRSRTAVVIGSGFGGLAAAVRLRSMGYRVTVLEALPDVGGRARVFRRDGYTFDAGPTVITAPYLLHELFALLGRDSRDYFELVPVDPFYRILFHDGSVFDYVGDEARLLEQIAAFEPRDVDGYRRLAAHAQRIFDVGYLGLADQPFGRFRDMARVVPDILRLGGHRSVHGLVARYIRDERLRQALTFEPLLVGGHPYRTSGIYLLIHWLERKWGVHFAKGGTAAIVEGLVRLLRESGVEVRTGAAVEEILVRDGRAVGVRTADRSVLRADVVVSNADPSYVYLHMIPREHRRRHTNRAVMRKRPSMSLFVGYFGADRQWPELAHHTVVLGPRYRGLLDDIFEGRRLADDFSLYLHAPTRTDPALAPAGHEAFYVLSPVPNNRSGVAWLKEGGPYFERILEHLEGRLLPGLGDALTTRFHITPDYFERELTLGGWGGVRSGAGADPVGLVPVPQSLGRRGRVVLRGRGHPPGRGRARRAQLREGPGAHRAGACRRGAPAPSRGPGEGRSLMVMR